MNQALGNSFPSLTIYSQEKLDLEGFCTFPHITVVFVLHYPDTHSLHHMFQLSN